MSDSTFIGAELKVSGLLDANLQHVVIAGQFEGDRALYNQYGVTMVSPDKCPSTATEQARIFVDWLISEAGQAAINSYNVNGQQLFFANAK